MSNENRLSEARLPGLLVASLSLSLFSEDDDQYGSTTIDSIPVTHNCIGLGWFYLRRRSRERERLAACRLSPCGAPALHGEPLPPLSLSPLLSRMQVFQFVFYAHSVSPHPRDSSPGGPGSPRPGPGLCAGQPGVERAGRACTRSRQAPAGIVPATSPLPWRSVAGARPKANPVPSPLRPAVPADARHLCFLVRARAANARGATGGQGGAYVAAGTTLQLPGGPEAEFWAAGCWNSGCDLRRDVSS